MNPRKYTDRVKLNHISNKIMFNLSLRKCGNVFTMQISNTTHGKHWKNINIKKYKIIN